MAPAVFAGLRPPLAHLSLRPAGHPWPRRSSRPSGRRSHICLYDRRAIHGPGGLCGPPAAARTSVFTTGGPSMAPAVFAALRPPLAHLSLRPAGHPWPRRSSRPSGRRSHICLYDRRAIHGPGDLRGPPAAARTSVFTTGGPSMAPAVFAALRPPLAHPGSRARASCVVARGEQTGHEPIL